MSDGIGLAEALLGLDGFRVLEVSETADEMTITVETTAEVRSLGHTLASWRTEIFAHHDTGAGNGPTEGLNLCVKRVKRCGHGFRSFDNYGSASCPRRRRHLAPTAIPTADPDTGRSPLSPVEPPTLIVVAGALPLSHTPEAS